MNALKSITANSDQTTSTPDTRTYRRRPSQREWGGTLLSVIYRTATEYSPHVEVSILPDRELEHPDIWWSPKHNDGQRPPHVRRARAFRYPLGGEAPLLAVGHPAGESGRPRPHLYLAASLIFDLAGKDYHDLEAGTDLFLAICKLIYDLRGGIAGDKDVPVA